MTLTTQAGTESVLSEQMLERFHQRAAHYDQENAFFAEDFEELKAAASGSAREEAGTWTSD